MSVPVTFDPEDRRQRRADGRWRVRVQQPSPSWDTPIRSEARLLRWEYKLLQRLCREGCVPALKIGREWRMRSMDLRGLARGEDLVP